MTDYADLIAKLEGADRGDSELDVALACALSPGSKPYAYGQGMCSRMENGVWFTTHVSCATVMVDSALDLIRKRLPGWAFSAGDDYHEGQCWARVFPRPREQRLGTGNVYAATVPLALCVALLTALQAQEAPSRQAS